MNVKIFFNYNKMQISFSLILFLLIFYISKISIRTKEQSLLIKNKDEQIILIETS